MSETYTKLFGSITDSTIWSESNETRLVWITMLAMSDRWGYVGSSVPGLASRARLAVEDVEVALAKFLAPDPYSRSQEHEGRRIEVADRGWTLLNYERFRDMRDEEARKEYERNRKREQRAKDKSKNVPDGPDLSRDVPVGHDLSAKAEASGEASAQTERDPETGTPAGAGSVSFSLRAIPDPDPKRAQVDAAKRVLARLVEVSGRPFRPGPSTLAPILARLADAREPYAEADLLAIVEHRAIFWPAGHEMRPNLRPSTLFRPSHCAEYLAEARANGKPASPAAPYVMHPDIAAYAAQSRAEDSARRKQRGDS
jgi:hypothetical protein